MERTGSNSNPYGKPSIEERERAAAKKLYTRYVQMNLDYTAWTILLIRRHPAAAQVLALLEEICDKENKAAITYKQMGDILEYKRGALAGAVKYLKDVRAIATERIGGTNVYYLNAAVSWQDYKRSLPRAKLFEPLQLPADEAKEVKRMHRLKRKFVPLATV